MSSTRGSKLATAVLLILNWNPSSLYAQVVSKVDLAPLRAKAVNVIDITFGNQEIIEYVGVAISRDGEVFHPAEDVFTSISHAGSDSRAIIVIVGRFGMGKDYFEFDPAGTYHLKVGVKFEDRKGPSVLYDRPVTILPTLPADQSFLLRIGASSVLRESWGEGASEETLGDYRARVDSDAGSDVRALAAIALLLEATQHEWVGNNFLGEKWREEGAIRRWGDTLLPLAKELPESSYAPYAAYFAGCCYAIMGYTSIQESLTAERLAGKPVGRTEEFRRSHQLAKDDQNCARAREAFALAAKRGDAYLRPRALYQLASLRATAGDFEAADAAFDDALEAAPGRGTIYDMVMKQRAGLAETRETVARKTRSGQRSNRNR